ncbi:BA14K family protein [Sulfitobacter aestuariivivens]|uniref:Lectin-like protein BA14k n=1 Tax=Sulfitobacter aestuariivivens TaxID=2766981 RepID=A0A927HEK9_9RHOB|nr:BA14K family protein [Sulfitobacter aestuariivivens]MBD3664001.1 BA14K family protein [Sulfitobacter aestuariivivens]
MPKYKTFLNRAGTFLLVLSLMAPPVGAAGLMGARVAMPTLSVGEIIKSATPDVVPVDHRLNGYAPGYYYPRPVRPRHYPRGYPYRGPVRSEGVRPRHGPRHYHPRRYRRHSDDWVIPLIVLGLGSALLNQPRQHAPVQRAYGGWRHIPAANLRAHDAWCDQKYRSYSRSTKTFQPYSGGRRYCNSPFDLL